MVATVRNPIEWTVDQVRLLAAGAGATGHALGHVRDTLHSPPPRVRRIGTVDLVDSLAQGVEDFGACRTDVIFLCAFYPIAGLVLGRVVFGTGLLPLLFPLAAGFALLGPLVAIGLQEMSRQREQGRPVSWATAFEILHAPSIGGILWLGLLLIAIFLAWLFVADGIYHLTFGYTPPPSPGAFLHAVFTTERGWVLIGAGIGAGFLFAVLVLVIGLVSFPLLLDRAVGIDTAIQTSARAVWANPGITALWGLIVAIGLALGSLPLLLGLIVVLPVLGHATWHLYRKLVIA